jgi:HK97 gp10 family phage protein
MATRVRLLASGVAEVHAAADRYAGRLAEEIADDMRRLAPVLSGALRATIRVEHGSPVTRIWVGDTAAGIDYHLYQEYGTSRMAAQPFIRPAVYVRRS